MFTYFSNIRIRELCDTAIELGLNNPARRSLLLDSIPPGVWGNFSFLAAPNDQIRADLRELNQIERLVDGSVPLLAWLSNAVDMVGLQAAAAPLRNALSELSGEVSGEPTIEDVGAIEEIQEKIVIRNDMLSYDFLEQGQIAGRSVAHLVVPSYENGVPAKLSDGNIKRYRGTGWLIGDRLLMTNHHVINARGRGKPLASIEDLKRQAIETEVKFDYDDRDAVGSLASTEELVAYDEKLDYAILRLRAPIGRSSLAIVTEPIALTDNEPVSVNIIQHPQGEPKKIAIRNNLVTKSMEIDLRYFTDTMGGSSGSPVCDDSWRVVALHRAAVNVENVSFQGKTAAWVNIGTHITAIAGHLSQNYSTLWREIAT